MPNKIKNTTTLKGAGYLIAATFFYSLFGVLSRTVGLSIPIFYQNLTRNLIGAFILVIIVTREHAWVKVKRKDWPVIIARNIAGIIAFLTFFFAILHVSFGTLYFIFYGGSTIIGFLFGRILFSERLTPVKLVSLVLAILGLAFVYGVNIGTISLFYAGLAFLSGAMTAFWNIISKKISADYSASYLSFWDETFSVIIYTIASLIARELWTLPSVTAPWMASLSIGVFFVICGILMINGFKYVEAQIGSVIMLAEIIFAIFFGWLFYRESISLLTLIGGAFIITAIVLPEWYNR